MDNNVHPLPNLTARHREREREAVAAAERDDGAAARLAIRHGITVVPGKGFALAKLPFRDAEILTVEYDRHNNDDPMQSYRRAVCRAVVEKAKHG